MDRLSDPDFAFRLLQGVVILLVVATAFLPGLRRRTSFVRAIAILYGGALVLAVALAIAYFLG
jgi:hypothetical protein